MSIRKTDLMAATLFVAMVTITLQAADPVSCEPDGKNWATVSEGCAPNDAIRTCNDAVPEYEGIFSDPEYCDLPTVFIKRQNGNFTCYSSEAISGQTTNCIQPKNPDGSFIVRDCMDKHFCVPQRVQGSWKCVSNGKTVTTTQKIWTNVACVQNAKNIVENIGRSIGNSAFDNASINGVKNKIN